MIDIFSKTMAPTGSDVLIEVSIPIPFIKRQTFKGNEYRKDFKAVDETRKILKGVVWYGRTLCPTLGFVYRLNLGLLDAQDATRSQDSIQRCDWSKF